MKITVPAKMTKDQFLWNCQWAWSCADYDKLTGIEITLHNEDGTSQTYTFGRVSDYQRLRAFSRNIRELAVNMDD